MELNKLIEIAKATLREKGSHNTILILIKDGKPSYYTLMFRNLQEKLEMQDAMRKVVELTKPEKYFVITDSWYAVQDGSMPSIRPSLRKDRKEALTLSEFNRDMTGKQAIVLYDRLGKRIKFHKPQIAEFKDMHSQFNFYLEKEGIDEAFDNEAKKVNEEFLRKISKEIANKYEKEFFAQKTEEGRKAVLMKIIKDGLKKKQEIQDKILPST